jgi:hypothetical protein
MIFLSASRYVLGVFSAIGHELLANRLDITVKCTALKNICGKLSHLCTAHSKRTNFLFSTSSRPALRPTQPPIQWVPGNLSPGRKADHSPPTSTKVKKIYISIHPLPDTPSWRSARLVKHRNNVTLIIRRGHGWFSVNLYQTFTITSPWQWTLCKNCMLRVSLYIKHTNEYFRIHCLKILRFSRHLLEWRKEAAEVYTLFALCSSKFVLHSHHQALYTYVADKSYSRQGLCRQLGVGCKVNKPTPWKPLYDKKFMN